MCQLNIRFARTAKQVIFVYMAHYILLYKAIDLFDYILYKCFI